MEDAGGFQRRPPEDMKERYVKASEFRRALTLPRFRRQTHDTNIDLFNRKEGVLRSKPYIASSDEIQPTANTSTVDCRNGWLVALFDGVERVLPVFRSFDDAESNSRSVQSSGLPSVTNRNRGEIEACREHAAICRQDYAAHVRVIGNAVPTVFDLIPFETITS